MPAKFRKGIDLNGQRAINAADASAVTDLTTLQQVRNEVAGITDLKDPVRVATTGNITLTGAQTIDGVAVAAPDRVLVKNQTTASANGIYVAAAGAWARAADADTSAEVTRGMSTTVLEGTTKGTGSALTNPLTYILTNTGVITLDTTALTFSPTGAGASTSYAAGAGLTEAPAGTFNVGAGTGISVAADAVAVDTAVVTRTFQADCAATTNPQTFTHGLGKRPNVDVILNSTGVKEYPDLTITTTDITVDWGGAPAAGEYRVIANG